MSIYTALRYSMYEGFRRHQAAIDAEILRRCTKIRVKAWRTPNEDNPPDYIADKRFEGVFLGPLIRRTTALIVNSR